MFARSNDKMIVGVTSLNLLKVANCDKHLSSKYSKFEFAHIITESQAFVLVFARKTTEFLTAKHWLS